MSDLIWYVESSQKPAAAMTAAEGGSIAAAADFMADAIDQRLGRGDEGTLASDCCHKDKQLSYNGFCV